MKNAIRRSTPDGPCLLLILPALACQGLSSEAAENLGSTEATQNTPARAPTTERFSTDASSFFGRWIGEAEDPLALGADPDDAPSAYRFPSGSTQISLEIAPQGVVIGTITFGSGNPPPAPVDPDVGYPAGVDYYELLNYAPETIPNFADPGPLPPHEGFPYYLLFENGGIDVPVQDGLLKIMYRSTQVLTNWCDMQTPFPDGQGGYSCIPGVYFRSVDDHTSCSMIERPPSVLECPNGELDCDLPGDGVQLADLGPVDCDKAYLCEMKFCECVDEGCFVATGDALLRSKADVTLRLVGDELVGVISNATFLNERHARAPLGRLRLHRAE